jgi:predicted AlkP superfamily pyrophosphatase or phosphodiesterase
MNEALKQVDQAIGELADNLGQLNANVIVVSDHGMAQVNRSGHLVLEDYMPDWRQRVSWIDFGPVTSIFPLSEASGDDPEGGKFVRELNRTFSGAPVRVYSRHEYPVAWHYTMGSRIPPIIVLCHEGYTLTYRKSALVRDSVVSGRPPMLGFHGFDPQLPSMHAVLVAAGPDIRPLPPSLSSHDSNNQSVADDGHVAEEDSGKELKVQNVDLYLMLAALLDVSPRPHNGSSALLPYCRRGAQS